MRKAELVVLVITVVLVVTATVGYVAWMRPDFARPSTWQGGESLPTTRVTLSDGARAELTDFPHGVTRLDEDGHPCLEATGERYSGEATWRALDPYAVEVTFGTSTVTISSDPGVLGSQDWTELRWRECTAREISMLGMVG